LKLPPCATLDLLSEPYKEIHHWLLWSVYLGCDVSDMVTSSTFPDSHFYLFYLS